MMMMTTKTMKAVAITKIKEMKVKNLRKSMLMLLQHFLAWFLWHWKFISFCASAANS
jgi:hypothetical protein